MDVNQIFKDLGMLVHEQGEVLGKNAIISEYSIRFVGVFIFISSQILMRQSRFGGLRVDKGGQKCY